MHSVKEGSFERFSTFRALGRAFLRCREGKARQPKMAEFDIDADRSLLALSRDLVADRYQPDPWRLRVVRDPKTRLIATPSIRDRVLHRALLDDIGPTYERSFVEASFAWGRGRGPHRATIRFLGAMRTYSHRMALDIRRYFPSIHRPTLLALFERQLRVPDRATVRLLDKLLAASGAVYATQQAKEVLRLEEQPLGANCGIGLGSYLSQWCGAFYLDKLDHFVQRGIKPGAYLRYMDDFVLFDDDARRLAEAQARIIEWLRVERRLELKRGCGRIVSTNEPCVFLGQRVSRSGICPSRKLRRRFERRLKLAAEKGPTALARTIAAYRGLLTFG